MAYERYIKKGGKIYGPYTYHSKKKDGKVFSEYIGKDIDEKIANRRKHFSRKIILFLGFFSFLILAIFLVFLLNTRLTGKASLEIENTYIYGEKMAGSVKLNLKNGEFLPTSTKVIIDNSGNKQEYLLSDLISESAIEGNYYIENKEITGSGLGYGIKGEKVTYPEVDFTLKISETYKEEKIKEESTDEAQQTETTNTEITISETTDTETEITQEETEIEKIKEESTETTASEITDTETQIGATQETSQETTSITGEVVSETIKEISGKVSKNNPYVYTLTKGQTAEITSSSKDVNLKIKDNIAEITTSYEEKEQGFGKDYLTNYLTELNIDITALGLIAKEGKLSVSLVYNNEELVSASKVISVENATVQQSEEKIKEEKNKTKEIKEKEVTEENITEQIIIVPNETIINITAGNISINTIQYRAVINKPVKWKKEIKSEDTITNISINLPKEADNITIYKVLGEEREELTEVAVLDKIEEQNIQASINTITGNVVEIQETQEVKEVNINENSTEFEIEYETPAPISLEKDTINGKEIFISSDVHYENILAYTELSKETHSQLIKLYNIINNSRQEVSIVKYDNNNNSLIDYIEWLVPSLSNQSYELEITILNVQSYPTVGGNWIVEFTTSGTADLTISAVDGTTWSNENENNDLKFLEIKCGDNLLSYTWLNNSVFIANYSCNFTGSETSKVITQGKHNLEFDFGGYKAYAHNTASGPIPQTLNVHGKLTNSTGSALNGTYNMTFRIYDDVTGGSLIWTSANNSVIVDSNGVYNHILSPINFSFNGEYYLSVQVGNDSEMTPKINLTSTPYTFRANISDTLDISKNYRVANLTASYFIGNGSLLTDVCLSNGTGCQVSSTSNLLNLSGTNANQDINISPYNFQAGNLTIADKITFRLNEVIDNLIDGWLRITGGLNITGNVVAEGNVTASYFKGNGSLLTDISGNNIINTKNWINNTNITTLCNSSGSCFTLTELNTSTSSVNYTNLAYLNNTNQVFTGINNFTNETNFMNITLLTGSYIKPSANSITALKIANSSGDGFVTFDTSNKKVSIGTSITGTSVFNIKGNLDSALTGTVSVDADSDTVTGVGTSFTTVLVTGDAIKIADEIFTILVITNNTILTLDSNHVAGASSVTAYRDSRNFLSVLTGDGGNQFGISRAGFVTIGVSSTTQRLIYGKKTFSTTGAVYGSFLDIKNTLSGSVVGQYVKGVSDNPSGTINENIGGFYQIEQTGEGTITTLSGFRALTTISSTGPVTNNIVLDVRGGLGNSANQTNNAKGISILDFSGSVGATTNASGIWIEKQTKGSTLNAGIVLNGDDVGSDLVLGAGQDAKIYWDGTNLIFNTNVTTPFTGIAWFSNNVSATGYITRTPSLKDYKEDFLIKIKSPDKMLDENGKLNRVDLLAGEAVSYQVIDYSRAVNVSEIKEICSSAGEDINCKNTTVIRTTYPYTKTENGMMLDYVEMNNRLLISELKAYINKLENRIAVLEAQK